jgi:hypothetical protein
MAAAALYQVETAAGRHPLGEPTGVEVKSSHGKRLALIVSNSAAESTPFDAGSEVLETRSRWTRSVLAGDPEGGPEDLRFELGKVYSALNRFPIPMGRNACTALFS